jgi:hypothetical protein
MSRATDFWLETIKHPGRVYLMGAATGFFLGAVLCLLIIELVGRY